MTDETDRLEEIKRARRDYNALPDERVDWLIAQIERLRAEVELLTQERDAFAKQGSTHDGLTRAAEIGDSTPLLDTAKEMRAAIVANIEAERDKGMTDQTDDAHLYFFDAHLYFEKRGLTRAMEIVDEHGDCHGEGDGCVSCRIRAAIKAERDKE